MMSFNRLKRNLKKDTSALKKISLAIVADNASQLSTQAICGYAIERDTCFDVYEADYDQVDAELFNHDSELYRFKPAFVVINLSSEHLLKKFYACGPEGRLDFAKRQAAYIQSLYASATANCSCKVIVTNFVEINDAVFGNYAGKEKKSFVYQLRKLNVLLMELAQESPGLFICDLLALQAQVGYSNVFNERIYVEADMVYSLEFLPLFAKAVTDIVLAITGVIKKCVVLDLDNTLWGGIIGDDGMEGIGIGSLGLGKAFTEFQLWLKELKRRGIILAVCSKNTEEIAKEPFREHPDMVLRLEDIALFVANWENKVTNIQYIQSVLNIGFDSMVFIDDNPFEREMVKSGIPEISVPDMPVDPVDYLSYLRSLNLFETASFTDEDEERTRQYQEEAGRAILQKSFADEDAFLQNLGMKSEVKPFDKFIAPRIAQLSQRSNQFNLRTVRYAEDDILSISQDKCYFTLSLTLEDHFGKHGLIAAIILRETEPGSLFIDTWIMSCRVLKRGMEGFTLDCIVDLARKANYKRIIGEYIPTRKNGIVKDHYTNLGFEQLEDKWVLNVDTYGGSQSHIQLKNEFQPILNKPENG